MNIVFHIGAAKTGTTTIQNALYQDFEMPSKVLNVGLCMELAVVKKYAWQNKQKAHLLQKLSENDFTEQTRDVLKACIDKNTGCETIVWSNEILFKYSGRLIPLINELIFEGHQVRVICYLREHLSWSVSAYEQFNLFSKTYSGKTKRFGEWIKTGLPSYWSSLEELHRSFPENIFVDFIENVGDLKKDFYDKAELELPKRDVLKFDNKKRSSEDVYIRTMFNDSSHLVSKAADFNKSISKVLDLSSTPESHLSSLFCNDLVLDDEYEKVSHDKCLLSAGFENLDIPASESLPSVECKLNRDVLIHNLYKIVFMQQRKIEELDQALAHALKNRRKIKA